jgi:hypothetical protein
MRQNIQMQRKQQMPKASGKIPPAHLKFAINELTVDIFISCQIRSARDCPTSLRMSMSASKDFAVSQSRTSDHADISFLLQQTRASN